MAWAPEMIYCEETGSYYIFFSSTVIDDVSKGVNAKILERDCVYYTTTRDFRHFSETKKFISNIKYQDNIKSRNEKEKLKLPKLSLNAKKQLCTNSIKNLINPAQV